jgi:primosomal protein N' (replication factor Y)
MNQQLTSILQIAVPTPLRRYFDYLAPLDCDPGLLQVGMRIKVPFQKRELVGILMGISSKSTFAREKLKTAISILDSHSLIPDEILQLCLWAADYYHYPIGEVLAAALPAWLRKGKIIDCSKLKKLKKTDRLSEAPRTLDLAQENVLAAIRKAANGFHVFLLDGVTGSGKTEVYLQAMIPVLEKEKQVLVLVPEIGLTPQTIQRFEERFCQPIITIHSGMTEKQRFLAWTQAKSGEANIIIGTRSAIFTPFKNLGLIIVDEEHDLSFKQQDGFRYHARDVAIKRAHTNAIPIILGSATPSLESLYNAQQQRYQHLRLIERAGNAKLPEFKIIDIRNQSLEQGLSASLLSELRAHVSKGDQVMLFLNRRGFSPVLHCPSCGWMVICKRCDTRMTYHYKAARLHCHHCDSQKNVMKKCEGCGATDLHPVGQGTERLEKLLEMHFPEYSIARIDRDSTRRKNAMADVLSDIQNGKHQILIGTQMLAKGHHFPNVTLVAIVDADSGFFSTDFRALERMGQLLLQVSGRAGRDEKPGKVLIQTRHPDHPLLYQLLHENYHAFSQTILQERSEASLPPFSFFALFRAEANQIDYAMEFLVEVKKFIKNSEIQVMGPIAAPMPRRAGRYRVQLLLQAKQRGRLQQVLKELMTNLDTNRMKQRVRWSLDVDPQELF